MRSYIVGCPALSGDENESQLSFYRFWCLFVHKTKNVKMKSAYLFPFLCVCSFKNQETIKGKSIFVFPFLCFLVHKRKNDKTEVIFGFSIFCVCLYIKKKRKTEVIFGFSVFCVCLNIKGKTIKRKSNSVFRFFLFLLSKKKSDKTEVKFCSICFEKQDSIKQ